MHGEILEEEEEEEEEDRMSDWIKVDLELAALNSSTDSLPTPPGSLAARFE